MAEEHVVFITNMFMAVAEINKYETEAQVRGSGGLVVKVVTLGRLSGRF